MTRRIYLSPPHLAGTELDYLHDAVESNWIAPLGPHVDSFEREMCGRIGVNHAVALSSGTAALHLALLVSGVTPGDDVLCSTLTFAATANAITYVGARPVFVDSHPSSWNLDPRLLADEISSRVNRDARPAAVVAVDLYGQCADYEPIRAACQEYDVPLIQDAAEALGAEYRGRPAGTQGDLAVLSFNGNKIITTSGGGMLVGRDQRQLEEARSLATQARDPAPHYQHSRVGFNYRMSNLLAAVGRAQLEVLDERVAARRRVNRRYRELLSGLPGLEAMPEAPYGKSTFWLSCFLVDAAAFGATRDDIRLQLEAEAIEARPVWKPMHLQPAFAGCEVRGGAVAEDLFDRGICLPSGSSLADEDIVRICEIIRALHRP